MTPISSPHRMLRPRRRRAAGPPAFSDVYCFDSFSSEASSASASDSDKGAVRGRKKVRLVVKLSHSAPRRSIAVKELESEESEVSSFVEAEADAGEELQEVRRWGNGKEDHDAKPPKKRRIQRRSLSAWRSRSLLLNDEEDEAIVVAAAKSRRRGRAVVAPSKVVAPRTPLPGRDALMELLHKLQKKDIYGAFAEPVDPEVIPDYHEVIEHPMDFETVRRKLLKNSYRYLEQFEDDVFLICGNAMQYNAPDTIYFRQAHSIQELAQKIFQKLKKSLLTKESGQNIQKKAGVNSCREETAKSSCRNGHEALASDISSAATHYSAGTHLSAADDWTALSTEEANAVEACPFADDGVRDNCSLGETMLEKGDEICVKDDPVKELYETDAVDENRRLTYNMWQEPSPTVCDPIFDAIVPQQQLIDLGPDDDYSYARSLARFASCFGQKAWMIASQHIRKTLPAEVKFGRGWVGEFEPLSAYLPYVGSIAQKHLMCNSTMHSVAFKNNQLMSQFSFQSNVQNFPAQEDSNALRMGTSVRSRKDLDLGGQSEMQTCNIDRSLHAPKLYDNGVVELKTKIGGINQESKARKTDCESDQGSRVFYWGRNTEIKASDLLNKGCHFTSDAISSVSTSQGSDGAPNAMANICIHRAADAAPSDKKKSRSRSSLPPRGRSGSSATEGTWVYHGRPEDGRSARNSDEKMSSSSSGCNAKNQFGDARKSIVNSNECQHSDDLANLVGRPNDARSALHPGRCPHNSSTGSFTRTQLTNYSNPILSNGQLQTSSLPSHVVESATKPPGSNCAPKGSLDVANNLQSYFGIAGRENQVGIAGPQARTWISFSSAPPFGEPPVVGTSSFLSSPGFIVPPLNVDPSQYSNTRIPSHFSMPTIPLDSADNAATHKELVVFPQLVRTELSRPNGSFETSSNSQMLSRQWQGLACQSEPKSSIGTAILRPDLNIGFPSPRSPSMQSSNLIFEAQQPDLALQL